MGQHMRTISMARCPLETMLQAKMVVMKRISSEMKAAEVEGITPNEAHFIQICAYSYITALLLANLMMKSSTLETMKADETALLILSNLKAPTAPRSKLWTL
jgi:hypothetical protein